MRWLAAVLGLVAAVGAIGAGPGRRGAVTLKFPSSPAPKTERHLTLVDADTGEIVDATAVGRRRQLVLRPTPDVLFATAADVGLRRAKVATSRAFLVDPSRAATATLRLRRATAGLLAGTPGTIVTRAAGGSIYSMGSIPVTIQGTDQTGVLGPALMSGVFDATRDAGARWVNTDPKFIEQRARELELQAQGKLDPSTPIHDELITPTNRIEGEATWADGHLSGEIRIVDAKTGEVIDRIPIDRDLDRDSMDDIDQLLRDLIDQLIREILERLSTTTTSITTTTSTSETSTTVPDTTTTTSLPPPPSTTVTTAPAPSTTSTTLVSCATGLLDSADVFRRIRGGVGASAPNYPTKSEPIPPVGPSTVPIGATGGADTNTWNLLATAGDARGATMGSMSFDVAPCQIAAGGSFSISSTGGTDTATASAGIDVQLQVTFRVKQQTPYTLAGWVRASGNASKAPPTSEYLKCSGNFDTADANLQHPSDTRVTFDKASTAFPGDEITVLCSVVRAGASTAEFGDDAGTFEWAFTVTLGQ